MAEIIPSLSRHTLGRMTAGERRFARRLEALLEDDYLVWYDIPLGRNRRYPDFIVLHPSRGLLFLEVKDWKPENLKRINKSDVSLLTGNGLVTRAHPLEQVRQYAYKAIDVLARDPQLCQTQGRYQGNLIMPYGWGVVFTHITRRQIEGAIPAESREWLLPDHLVIYKDEMTESAVAETFQEQLWGMFNYNFGRTLSLPQIDRVRWHLFPEVRIGADSQFSLFDEEPEADEVSSPSLPDIVRIMDIQQEQLARSLGEGHRVIHGVSGAGKTLILGFRCLHLAKALAKPILVLCYNITLAARLRSFISARGIANQVQIYHFHDWCGQQIKTYHVELVESDRAHWERQVDSVIHGVEQGWIPRGQYGALLIDEGHDFQEEWLKLVVQMVDPATDSLLLLYDDAQSIYKRSGLRFTLSSVGIKAQGRTTILRLNYRNTREILAFAYTFAAHYLVPHNTDDDHIPLVTPEAAGVSGPAPVVRVLPSLDEEVRFAAKCIKTWHEKGVHWRDMAVLAATQHHGRQFSAHLHREGIPHSWLGSKARKLAYSSEENRVTIVTIHSSKGLEFPRVIILGVGQLRDDDERLQDNARLLYVGMTRAQGHLLLTTSLENDFTRRLNEIDTQGLPLISGKRRRPSVQAEADQVERPGH